MLPEKKLERKSDEKEDTRMQRLTKGIKKNRSAFMKLQDEKGQKQHKPPAHEHWETNETLQNR